VSAIDGKCPGLVGDDADLDRLFTDETTNSDSFLGRFFGRFFSWLFGRFLYWGFCGLWFFSSKLSSSYGFIYVLI
jgi:hypothetical protein